MPWKQIFDSWSRATPSSKVIADWADIEGPADQLVGEWGRRADFIVLKRPTGRQLDQEHRVQFYAALFASGRPVLVVPPETPPAPLGRRIGRGLAGRCSHHGRRCSSGLASRAGRGKYMCSQERATHHSRRVSRTCSRSTASTVAGASHVLPITGHRAFGEALLRTARQLAVLDTAMLVMGAFVHPVQSLIPWRRDALHACTRRFAGADATLREAFLWQMPVLVVLRRPELADTLLRAAQRMATLMGGARLSVLAVREPIEVSCPDGWKL